MGVLEVEYTQHMNIRQTHYPRISHQATPTLILQELKTKLIVLTRS